MPNPLMYTAPFVVPLGILMATGEKVTDSKAFTTVSRIASIAGPIIAMFVLYEMQRYDAHQDQLVKLVTNEQQQIMLIEQTDTSVTGTITELKARMDKMTDAINDTRELAICLKDPQICRNRSR